MSSPAAAAVGDVLPALPPIKTAAPAGVTAAREALPGSAAPSTAAPEAKPLPEVEVEEAEEEAEPTTPTSEESRLNAPAECPPAPRKPAWTASAKRKSPGSPSQPARRPVFFAVPRDLSAVFRSLPPKKRIRAG